MPRSSAPVGVGGAVAAASPAPAPRRRRLGSGLVTDAVMIGPALALVAAFVIVPIGIAVYLSFTDWNGFTLPPDWIGARNYERLVQDPEVLRAAAYTALIAIV